MDHRDERQILLPKWIRGLCWSFLLRAGALPFFWLFVWRVVPARKQFEIFGFGYVGSPFDTPALQVQGIYLALGFTAYGLLWARPWGVDAGITCAVVGLALCAITTLVIGFQRFLLAESFVLVLFLTSLLSIRREWHDHSPWRSGASALLVAVVAAVGITLVFRPSVSQRTERSSDPVQVTVVIVGSAKKVAQVRAAVAKSEVVAESAGAFALRRHQVVAASYEDVGPLMAKAGWQGASIALWAPAREAPLQGVAVPSANNRWGDLVNKPSLSEFEARRLLDLLMTM